MFLKMKLFFFVVALFVSTTAALEKDHWEKLKMASRELNLVDHFEAKEISPAKLARLRRGVDPQCYNAGLQVVRKCPFTFSVFTDAYTGSEDAALTVKQLNDILCSNAACYNAVLNVYQICEELQFFARTFEENKELNCKVNANGTYCLEASLAFSNNISRKCLQTFATCRSDRVCNEHFNNLINQHGCCMKEAIDHRFASLSNFDFFEFCDLSDPGNCSSTNISKVTPSVSTPPPTSPPTDPPIPSPSPTTPSIPMPRCDRKAEEFVKIRECSGGVDIQKPLIFAQPLSNCEYQLYSSRFCQRQKCMDNLVDLLQVCFNESGTNEGDSTATLDFVLQAHSNFYCAKDPERKDFCAVMFPEIMFGRFASVRYNLTCALSGNLCSSECSEEVERAIDYYGCCLSQYLKMRLRANPNKIYRRCDVTPPKPCRFKLKDPRAK